MVRLKRSPAVVLDPVREAIRERAARAVAVADGKLVAGPSERWVADGLYDWGRLWAEDANRRRLQQLDAGEPVVVARWEIPMGTRVPAIAHSYVSHADGRLTVHEITTDTVERAR